MLTELEGAFDQHLTGGVILELTAGEPQLDEIVAQVNG